MLNRNVRLICLHTFCTNLLFLLPVIVLYSKHIGLTFQQFLIGEAIFAAVLLLCEVPSGWISDIWKRRTTLMLASLVEILGFSFILLAENFWQMVIGQAILGVGVSLVSGTNTALLYDTLLEAGREADYRRIDGIRHACGIFGVAFAALVGAYAYTIHPKLPATLDIWFCLIAMVTISMVHEPKRHMKSVERHMLHDIFKTMKYALSGHVEIAGIIMLATVIFCTTKLMLWVQQPYYAEIGVPVIWFGIIMSASYLISGMAGMASHRLEHLGSNRSALVVMLSVLIASCALLGAGQTMWTAMVLFLVGTLVYGMGVPRINSAINSRVGSERRATILSTANLMVQLLFIPTGVIIGAITDEISVYHAMLWIAGQTALLGGLGLWLWSRKTERVRVPA